MTEEQKQALLAEVEKLHQRNELSKTVGPDWYDPGMMEYLDQSDGTFDPATGSLLLRFEARGTRYEGRTEQIESVHVGDSLKIVREPDNSFNANNFRILTAQGRNVGNMPAELCNVIAPLFDEGSLLIDSAAVSFVEPISHRSRHAKQAILFLELQCSIQQ